MKKPLSVLLSALLLLSLAAACGKKKDEKKAADAPAMGTETPPASVPDMKEAPPPEQPKPEVTAKPGPAPTPAVAPPTITALSELGTPMIAVHVELAKIFASPAFQATGLEDKLNSELMDDEDFDRAAVSACLGLELKKVSELVTSVTVFGNGGDDLVILADTPVESEKLLNCMKSASKKKKKNRMTETAYGPVKGFKVADKDGDVTHLVPVGRNRMLFVIGEQKDLVAKLKVGEGHLGTGDVAGYFHGGPQAVKVVLRNLPLDKMNKDGGKVQIPNLKSGDLDAQVGLDAGLRVDVRLDAKDPKAAEALVAMGTIMKGLADVREQMAAIGLDAGLLDAIQLKAAGPVATLAFELDAARAAAIAATLKKQLLDKDATPSAAVGEVAKPEPVAKPVTPPPPGPPPPAPAP